MNNENIEIGSYVTVIDDTIRGKVLSINAEKVQIEDEHGFLYSYFINELVLVNDELYENVKVVNKDEPIHKKQKPIVLTKNKNILEVDLHIDQIIKSNRFMSNQQMLQRQLTTAQNKLNFAIRNNIQKVIFIHGVGKGVLKEALLKMLKEYPTTITDASFKKYGYGALEVYIYKSKK